MYSDATEMLPETSLRIISTMLLERKRICGGYRWRRRRKRQKLEMPLRKFMRDSKLSNTIIGGGGATHEMSIHPVIPLVAIAQLFCCCFNISIFIGLE